MSAEVTAELKRKNKGTNSTFFTTGLNNVAELVDDSLSEDDAPPVPQPATSKFSFRSLIGKAKKGGQDYVSQAEKEAEQQKINEYNHAHEQPITALSTLPSGLPSLQTLQDLHTIMQNNIAYKGDSYRPNYANSPQKSWHREDEYRPSSPYLDTQSAHIVDARHLTFSSKVYNPHSNSCQVSLCDHEHFCIEWDSSDPDNRMRSWISRLKYYWDDALSREDHKSCQQPDSLARLTVLAERIIQKFTDMENGKLSWRDIRNGLQAARPPPLNRVEREVRTMYSHLFRGETEKFVEKKEALCMHLNIAQRRKEFAEKTQQRAQEERQRKTLAKVPDIDDLKDKAEPVLKGKPSTVRVRFNENNSTQAPIQNSTKETRKVVAAPGDRFRPTTETEHEKRKARHAEQARQRRAAYASTILRQHQKSDAVRSKHKPKPKSREMTAEKHTLLKCIRNAKKTENDKNTEADEQNKSLNQAAGSEHHFKSNRSEVIEEVHSPVSPCPARKQVNPPVKSRVTNPGCVVDSSYSLPTTKKPAAKPNSKKHKALPNKYSVNNEQLVKKNGRKNRKSAVITEDSDQEAGYELPKVNSQLPEDTIREGWQVGGTALVEEIVHQQRDLEQQRDTAIEHGDEVDVFETIETLKTTGCQMSVKDVPQTSLEDQQLPSPRESSSTVDSFPSSRDSASSPDRFSEEIPSTPASTPSSSKKRKNSADSDLKDAAPNSPSPSRPVKKLKMVGLASGGSSPTACLRPIVLRSIHTAGGRTSNRDVIPFSDCSDDSGIVAESPTREDDVFDNGIDGLCKDDED